MSGQRGDAVERVLAALRQRGKAVRQNGAGYKAQCPVHDDHEPSLGVTQGPKGARVRCWSQQCPVDEVLAALGLVKADLADEPRGQGDDGEWTPKGTAVAVYDYTDEDGSLLFQVCRTADKQFPQRVPDRTRKSGWRWQLGGTRRVPYHLPQLLAGIRDGNVVWIAEGERDVLALEAAGVIATCNPGGAGKWRAEYDQYLAGAASVRIVQDKDDAGRRHSLHVAEGLRRAGLTVEILEALEGKDAADHLGAGQDLDAFSVVQSEPADREDPDDGGSGRGEGRGPSQSAVLVQLAADRYRLLGSEDGRPYAVKRDGPNVALLLRGKGALRSHLAKVYADNCGGRVPSAAALTDALTVLEGRAADADPEPVHLRLAQHAGGIVLDLGTADGRCVVTRAEGWRREPRSPVLFRRTKLTSVIPDPIRDGDGLERLRDLLNAEEAEFRLIVGWMIAALVPDIPHPILALRGEQGAAKSSTAQMLVDLIDPSPAPLRSVPRDMKQWAVAASASWAVALDNVSQIPGWLSDTLCKAVTGDGYVDRVLYSDDDVTVLAFRRAVILTSIDPGALAGDLAERLLIVELQPILDTKRRAEAEVRQMFASARSAILASLLDLLALVMAELPQMALDRMPRMADFARVLAALDRVQGWQTLDVYVNASADVAADVLEGDVFASAVTRLMEGTEDWTGTATELLERISPEKPPKDWPKDPTRAGGRLKRIATALRAIGIEVTESRSSDRNRTRLYTITKRDPDDPRDGDGEAASAASAASGMVSDQQGLADASQPDSVRASVRTLASTDAADAAADATAQLASGLHTTPDLHEQSEPDAADVGDAADDIPSFATAGEADGGEFWAQASGGEEWSG